MNSSTACITGAFWRPLTLEIWKTRNLFERSTLLREHGEEVDERGRLVVVGCGVPGDPFAVVRFVDGPLDTAGLRAGEALISFGVGGEHEGDHPRDLLRLAVQGS